MRNGWVKLHRQSLDSRVFHKAELWKLWSWLLMNANIREHWADEETLVGPGQLLIGRHQLADALKCKPSTAWDRILKLRAWGMIELKSDTRGTLVTICNWQTYQVGEPEYRQPAGNQPTAGQHPAGSRPTLYKKGRKKKGKNLFDDVHQLSFPQGLDTSAVQDSLRELSAYRREIGKPLTARSLQRLVDKFARFGPDCLCTAIGETITHGWTGVFSPDERTQTHGARHGNLHPTRIESAGTVSQLQQLRGRTQSIPAGDAGSDLATR